MFIEKMIKDVEFALNVKNTKKVVMICRMVKLSGRRLLFMGRRKHNGKTNRRGKNIVEKDSFSYETFW